MKTFRKQSVISASKADLYRWHASGQALQRLTPPSEKVKIISWKGGEKTQGLTEEEQFGDISTGARVHLKTYLGPVGLSMVARHVDHQEEEFFVDQQEKGPFAYWKHVHRFTHQDDHTSLLDDDIEYRLPVLRPPFTGKIIENKIQKMFAYRHYRTTEDLRRHAPYRDRAPMRVAITGSSGLIGRELASYLRSVGHTVLGVSRKENPVKGMISMHRPSEWEGLDAVVHLAGESINGLWTKSKKEKILSSREKMTVRVSKILAGLHKPPGVFISSSAVGFYGDRGDEELVEDSTPGNDFLSDVCQRWERSTEDAKKAGIRCVIMRTGVVITPKGGALQKMLLPFSMGLGGPVGSGRQWMSWISLDDMVYLLYFLMQSKDARGVFNATAPHPVQNQDFGKTLGKSLHRPAFMPLPAFMVRVILGEMGDALLLTSAKVLPQKPLSLGYEFSHPTLTSCFSAFL
ncbi:MAG: TIGR01777 family oxidoreductase [Myxococcota bacterium]|nr:TIGR01777 family oxidoreductase [Myxococcota bacterium]